MSWSNLPLDILNLIASRLYFLDRTHLQLVCKNWRLVRGNRPLGNLPWLMAYKYRDLKDGVQVLSEFILIDPLHDRTFSFTRQNPKDSLCIANSKVCASKFGWLLLLREIDTRKYFFFWYPFNDEVIKLPYLEVGRHKITFSSSPYSKDCTIFIVHGTWIDNMIQKTCISTYNIGDHGWKTVAVVEYYDLIRDVIYSDTCGILYCLFHNAVLGSYDFKNHRWSVLVGHWNFGLPNKEIHMIECDGEIFMMMKGSLHPISHVYKFEVATKRWLKVSDMGNRALFWGPTLHAISGDLKEGEREVAKKVYGNMKMKVHFYPLQDKLGKASTDIYTLVTDYHRRIFLNPPFL